VQVLSGGPEQYAWPIPSIQMDGLRDEGNSCSPSEGGVHYPLGALSFGLLQGASFDVLRSGSSTEASDRSAIVGLGGAAHSHFTHVWVVLDKRAQSGFRHCEIIALCTEERVPFFLIVLASPYKITDSLERSSFCPLFFYGRPLMRYA